MQTAAYIQAVDSMK